jgi:cobyrinic acid a,c-diamide synthase|tara:strand:+ start:30263 stop:31579 length:1317 start_codon:yes stop_codon:yes gene_type:complete
VEALHQPALLIAAPASGSGKTTVTLALLRAFRRQGIKIGSFKVGPDYIDPAFHTFASGTPCFNLDLWAMRRDTQAAVLSTVFSDTDMVIGEGVMGLFDGAQDGSGSTADTAAEWNLPVVLIVNAKGQAASVAALIQGFDKFRTDTRIAGVIFNNVGGEAHIRLLEEAATAVGVKSLGFIPKSDILAIDHRHLGLVQARENPELNVFLENAADIIERHCDLDGLKEIAKAPRDIPAKAGTSLVPFAQKIAVAEDNAFAFTYPHLLNGWRASGAEISFFSPLADEQPDTDAGAIYLPGGYPELYGAQLAAAGKFKRALKTAAAKNKPIYGECGGFMVLGKNILDKGGTAHEMLNLLPIETSFAKPKLHLGYRNARLATDCILGDKGDIFSAHEFHYASIIKAADAPVLFNIQDARGADLGNAGTAIGSVSGSFIHLIDRR